MTYQYEATRQSGQEPGMYVSMYVFMYVCIYLCLFMYKHVILESEKLKIDTFPIWNSIVPLLSEHVSRQL